MTKDEVISIHAGIRELGRHDAIIHTLFILTLRINRLPQRHEDAVH